MQTDIIGVTIGILGIVIGVVVSYYFYKKSVRIKEPAYSIKSNNIISGTKSKYENLKVLYYKKEVENFTVSKILFYNKGNETITRQDIETSYPLRISTKNCQLLDAFTLQVNKPSNNFSLTWDKSGEFLYLEFDYLDQNQGAVIQVIHTGLSSEAIDIVGDIMGATELVRIPFAQIQPTSSNFFRIMRILFIIFVSVVTAFFYILLVYFPGPNRPNVLSFHLGALVFSFLLALAIVIIAAPGNVKKAMKWFLSQIRVPKGLEIFLE